LRLVLTGDNDADLRMKFAILFHSAHALFPNFLSDRVTIKSASDKYRRARLNWRDEKCVANEETSEGDEFVRARYIRRQILTLMQA